MKKLLASFVLGMAMLTSVGCAGSLKASSSVAHASSDGYVYSSDEVPDYVVIESDEGFAASIENEEVTVVVEPEPWTVVVQVPPQPPAAVVVTRPSPPYFGAIWVDGYWRYGGAGFVWVAGHYVPPRAGYVFVAPRWVYRGGRYHHFPGYYRPTTAYVRTHFSHSHYYRPYPRPYYSSPPVRHHYGHVSYHGRVSAQPRPHGYPPRPVAARPPVPARPVARAPQTPAARPRANPSPRAVAPSPRVARPAPRSATERPRVVPPAPRSATERPRVVPPVSRTATERPRVVPPVHRSVGEPRALPPSRAAMAPRAEASARLDGSGARGRGGPPVGPTSRSAPTRGAGHSVSATVTRRFDARGPAPRGLAPASPSQPSRGGSVARGPSRASFRPSGSPPAHAGGQRGPTAARSGARARP